MSAFDYDVVISGAGPAGTAVAMRLVRREPTLAKRILVLDRAKFPRDKPCGGGLTGHATMAMRELGFELSVPNVDAHTACVRYFSHERKVSMPSPVTVVRREQYDHSLVEQVRAQGVEVREGCGLKGYSNSPGGVVIETKSGQIRTRALIAADGVSSVARRRLIANAGTPLRLFRAVVKAPAGFRHSDEMIYDFSLMPKGLRGYLWLFPLPDGYVNVGVLHHAASGRSGMQLVKLLQHGLARYGLALPDNAARGWPAWAYRPRQPIAHAHVMLVGDSAGIDELTGEGIAVAMEQAIICADHTVEALATGDFSFADYSTTVRRATVGRELWVDSWLARLLYRSSTWEHWLSLTLFDRQFIELYAARVCGNVVLADRIPQLMWTLAKHAPYARSRLRQLRQARTAEQTPR